MNESLAGCCKTSCSTFQFHLDFLIERKLEKTRISQEEKNWHLRESEMHEPYLLRFLSLLLGRLFELLADPQMFCADKNVEELQGVFVSFRAFALLLQHSDLLSLVASNFRSLSRLVVAFRKWSAELPKKATTKKKSSSGGKGRKQKTPTVFTASTPSTPSTPSTSSSLPPVPSSPFPVSDVSLPLTLTTVLEKLEGQLQNSMTVVRASTEKISISVEFALKGLRSVVRQLRLLVFPLDRDYVGYAPPTQPKTLRQEQVDLIQAASG
jgi:hypothetical protein